MTLSTQPAQGRRAKSNSSAFIRPSFTRGVAVLGTSGLVFGLGIAGGSSAYADPPEECDGYIPFGPASGAEAASANVHRIELELATNGGVCLDGDFLIDQTIDYTGTATVIGRAGSSITALATTPSVFDYPDETIASLVVENVDISNPYGKVIYAFDVEIRDSTFFGHEGGLSGGAIAAERHVTISNSTFSNFSPTDSGGVIYAAGDVHVSRSTFSSNAAGLYGGAIWTAGNVTITDSTFSSNRAGEDGGAVSAQGDVNVSNSTFYENAASGVSSRGGAIFAYAGEVNFSTFVNNSASEPDPSATGDALYGYGDREFKLGANLFAAGSPQPQLGFLQTSFSDMGGNVFSTSEIAETPSIAATSGTTRYGHSLSLLFGTSSPVLATYAPNTSNTQTIGLAAGSPALGIVPNTAPFTSDTYRLDQRGATRVHPRDAGAFQGVIPAAPASSGQSFSDFTVITLPSGTTKPGADIRVFGSNLSLVKEVYVNGVKVKIKKQDLGSIVFTTPRGLTGFVDVRFVSANSQYTAFRALDFGTSAVGATNARTVVGGFAANSTRLTFKMKREIRAFLKANPGSSTVTCLGFTSEPSTLIDKALANTRGQVTCAYIKKINSDLTAKVEQGRHTQQPGSGIRRVRIIIE